MLADDFGQDNQGILPDNRFNFKVPRELLSIKPSIII